MPEADKITPAHFLYRLNERGETIDGNPPLDSRQNDVLALAKADGGSLEESACVGISIKPLNKAWKKVGDPVRDAAREFETRLPEFLVDREILISKVEARRSRPTMTSADVGPSVSKNFIAAQDGLRLDDVLQRAVFAVNHLAPIIDTPRSRLRALGKLMQEFGQLGMALLVP